jgi:hypothetical protein
MLAHPAGASQGQSITFIVGAADGSPPRDGPIQARLGQRVRLYAVVQAGRGPRAIFYSAAPSLTLHGRKVSARRLRPLGELEGTRFEWLQVEPHPHHVDRDPPNPGNPAYSNAILFGRGHGTWLGYDRIEYHETLLSEEHGPSLAVTRARPTHPKVNVHRGLGTMRYKVVVRAPRRGEETLASPGAEAAGERGISPEVTRVSFRSSDDLVGYLTTYFNVPNVFGSGGDGRTHQAELYQGADCADVIVGAARQAGARIAYTSVLGLRSHARPVTERLVLSEAGLVHAEGPARGQPVRLRFGTEVRVGDIMLIDYQGFADSPRTWDHVAVIAEDRGVKGLFDPQDLVLHMGYLYGLTEAPAHTEGPAIIQLLRFVPAVWASRRPHGKE